MTLNDKFDVATDGWMVADRCEEIADEFAIGFFNWYEDDMDINRVRELLEIYKKEKGL